MTPDLLDRPLSLRPFIIACVLFAKIHVLVLRGSEHGKAHLWMCHDLATERSEGHISTRLHSDRDIHPSLVTKFQYFLP